ncbi:hypothetical protein [Marinobacter sp.]|uniref:hypothetical protein n=1 Tax=Marinobacter sp. TaxID=50741 RepID=UPI00384EA9DF
MEMNGLTKIFIKKDLDQMDLAGKSPSYTQNFDTLLYRVRPADTLIKTLKRYHPFLKQNELSELIAQVLKDNPAIQNPDHIWPDQLIRLRIPQNYCGAPSPFNDLFTVRTDSQRWVTSLEQDWSSSTPQERSFMSMLMPVMIAAGSTKATMLQTTFQTNTPLLVEMIENYESYKIKGKTKGQYDYRRAQLVDKFTRKLGPTNLILNGTAPPTEVLRISRVKGTTPVHSIESQISRMKGVSSLAKSGGVALSLVGLGMACGQIGAAKTRHEKNEILLESGSSLIAGVTYGIGASVAVALFATPVGWVAGLIIGAGSVAAGYFAGSGAKALYNASGDKIDFVKNLNVDFVCRPSSVSPRNVNRILSSNALSAF